MIKLLLEGLQTFPIVALVGPRQVGKTSLARLLHAKFSQAGQSVVMLDLERPSDLAKLNGRKRPWRQLSNLRDGGVEGSIRVEHLKLGSLANHGKTALLTPANFLPGSTVTLLR